MTLDEWSTKVVYSGPCVVDAGDAVVREHNNYGLAFMMAFSLDSTPKRYGAEVEEGRCLTYSRAEYRALFRPELVPELKGVFDVAGILNRSIRETDNSGVHQLIWNLIEGNWDQMQGVVKERWDALTDDDLVLIAGNRERLSQKIRERYGYEDERTEQELDNFTGVSEFRHG